MEVYDILNCGPRNRFTVLTENGPLLVHNCENYTQAVARDVLFDLMMRVEAMTAAGWPGRIVIHVHDEIVVEAPEKQADQCLADVLGLMAEPPSWAASLPVKGAGGLMPRYGK